METVEAYFERKSDELGLFNSCLRTPLSLTHPRSLAEVIEYKFQLAAALKAELALGDWTATETAWAPIQHRSGPFEFTYDYQRADLSVRGPPFYEIGSHRPSETIYTSSGMAAIAALLFASARLIQRATIVVPPGSYAESQELIHSYVRHLEVVTANSATSRSAPRSPSCRFMLLDSSLPSSSFEAALHHTRPADLLIFDTTCFCATSGRIHRVVDCSRRWNVPLAMVRSHTKLDSLGAEYGRLGSVVFVNWETNAPAGWASEIRRLPDETRNALRLFGGAAMPAHFPPFVGTPAYHELTTRRTAAILRNSRRARRYFSNALRNFTAELHFAHGLYVTLKSAKPLSEQTAGEAATALSADLHLLGLPISHAGSFGFDFAATEWFRDRASGEYFIRISVPDLPALFWDALMEAIAKWWLIHEG
jgi:hypothetical protein